MKKLCFLLILISNASLYAQKVTFDPVDWQTDQPVTIRFDFNGTPFSGFLGDLYLWAWTKNGANESIDSPKNGTWGASNADAKLTDLGGNIRTITFTPSTYYGFSSELLAVTGINFLVKDLTGSQKTENFENLKPFAANGIQPNTAWSANKKVRVLVDVSATPLAGFAGPLYLWSWYTLGGVDINSPNNGTWTNSSAASQMTRIGTTDNWYIDIEPTVYYATSSSNLTPTTIFGLVKKLDGNNGKTDDFGYGKTYKKYGIYQLNASNVELIPTLPYPNVPVTIRFTAKNELANTSASVFMHSGVVTEGLSSTTWSHTQGIWGDSLTSPGKMTKVSTNVYELSIPSINSYYGLSTNEIAYKIMAVFRSADGTVIEKDGTSDYQLEVHPARYLEIREPVGTFVTKPINEVFRITGYTNETSTITIKINNTTVYTTTAANRATYLYTPTSAGSYQIDIEANNGTSAITKSIKVVVCATTSIANPVALPANLKYGINYNASDATKATLVLHAPTENIKSVHVIGDFNNWQVDCNYLMNWDNVKKVFWKELTGLTAGQEYVFQYLIDGSTRIGDPYTAKVSDPWNDASIPSATYPNLIQYPTAAMPQNGETPTIASVLQTNQTAYQWETTSFNRIEQKKLNIYQLHFRDFTTEGTYLAAIQKLDYLKRMGINAIETLPVSEFEGNDSWGYNPNYYFAVDKAYGTANDYKKFVDECHKRGIAVLGDLVLNHAFGTNPHARMYWDNLRNRPANNNPWFNAVSNFANPAAQWGNDFNHESLHTQAFVDTVIYHWLNEYKIDGIRFDFTKGFGNTPYPNANCSDEWGGCYDASRIALLKRMANKMWLINNGATGSQPYIVFEHLATSSEDIEIGNYGNGIMLWSGVTPNHKYGEVAMGWAPDASDPYKSDLSVAYYKSKGFSKPVWVSYMESHDEDRLGYFQTAFGNGTVKTDLAVRSQFLRAAATMNLLFTGPRQVWQFGELGYDYNINYNGRTGKKPIRWDYFDVPERKAIYEMYSRLFWLRNAMPNTFHQDFDNPSGTKTDLVSQFKRYHFYSSVGDTAVTIIANTANSVVTGNPDFNGSTSAQWYDFVTQQWVTVSNSMSLQPGEYHIYFNKKPVFTAPTFSLTAITTAPTGADTTSILISFNEPVLKKVLNSFLGTDFTAANINSAITLVNASNQNISFNGSISFDKKALRIKPTTTLPVGTYTISVLADSVQNFGGITFTPTATFTFTVEKTCTTTMNLVSTADDYTNQTITQQVSQAITATNKSLQTAKVTYDAQKYVLLSPGFEATPSTGGYFLGKIGGCN